MSRPIFALFALTVFYAQAALAQTAMDSPVSDPTVIEEQPLPAPSPTAPSLIGNQPTPLMPSQAETTRPNEGPEERSLDQALGNAPAAPLVKPTPHTDASIEDRITATVLAPQNSTPASASTQSLEPPTQLVTGSMSHPSTVSPAATSRWEGPQERALDQALPGTNLVAPQGMPDVEEDEVRRLNGGDR